MSQVTFSQRMITKLIDWLLALLGASILLWFFVTQPVMSTVTNNTNQIANTNELKRHVQLLTNGYAPRTINYDNLNNTADYIYQEFARVGIPEYQAIHTLSKQYHNVSLQLGPDTRELYVIGAHYDAEDDSIDTEGNASGVATLIELARHLALNNDKLNIGVILIAYPLSLNQSDNRINTGSYFHADSLKIMNKKVRLMISLDSVGQDNSIAAFERHPYKFMDILNPSKANHLNMVGRLKDFKNIRQLKRVFNSTSALSLNSHTLFESFNKTQSSDHVNYWNQGFPAVLISDNLEKGKLEKNDTNTEIKDRLDYVKMAMLVNGLYQSVIKTSTGEADRTLLAQRSRNKKVNSLVR